MTGETEKRKKRYCEIYPNIHSKVVEAVRDLVKDGLWQRNMSNQDKAILMGLFVQKVSKIYKVEPPKFYFLVGYQAKKEYEEWGGGMYNPVTDEMFVYHIPSLMTLLHEFRHAMQFKNPQMKKYKDDLEKDARAWSHSLYAKALPNSYKKASEQDLFRHR